jgi:hypothetical protein
MDGSRSALAVSWLPRAAHECAPAASARSPGSGARRHHAICIVIITGWAQVSGLRGEVDTLERARARVAHDLYYIEHWSPWLDLKILLKRWEILASRDNAY